jgi:hypothetical protein
MKCYPLKYLLFFPLFFFISTFQAQKLTQFSSDTMKFMGDLNTYFIDNSANKELAENYIKTIEKLWKDNVITGYYKEIAIITSNTMLSKRMKPYPYFQGYFNTLVNSIQSKHSFENFENWQLCVDKILTSKSNRGVQEFFKHEREPFSRQHIL